MKGRLLVATPALVDPHFFRTVVYLLDHDEDGSVGLVLNRPTDTSVEDVVPRWGMLTATPHVVFGGGPVSVTAAICVARLADAELAAGGVDDLSPESSGFQRVVGPLGTVDLKVAPEDLPVRLAEVRVFVGYAGWDGAQLQAEIDDNAWVVVDALVGDLFTANPQALWTQVLRRQGGWLKVLSGHPLDPAVN